MWTASPAEISAARTRIDPVFLDTPLRRAAALDARFGAELLFKDETANPIRSFKGRGACNLVQQLSDGQGLVCASAGNFGQGLAWAARLSGQRLTVFASHHAVASKIEAMLQLGAVVLRKGEDFDAAKQAAMAYAAAKSLLYIEDGAVAAIAEGAGTLALEALDELGPLDAFVCPLGNGALAAGTGSWVKHQAPQTEMIAVAVTGAPAMARSVKEGTIVTTEKADTIADGIAVRIPIPSAVKAVREVVDDVLLVDDDHIRTAMRLLKNELGLVVEPAGAAGLAAIIASPERWRGKRVAVPLGGGNV